METEDRRVSDFARSVTIRDLVLFAATLVSIVVAWGANETRVSLLEQHATANSEMITQIKSEIVQLHKEVNAIQAEITRIEYQLTNKLDRHQDAIEKLEHKRGR